MDDQTSMTMNARRNGFGAYLSMKRPREIGPVRRETLRRTVGMKHVG